MFKKLVIGILTLSISLLPLKIVVASDVVNLISNPSLETAQDANTPQGWSFSQWGTNTAVPTYLNEGRTGSHSIKTEVTAFTDGATNWFINTPVTAGKTYKFSTWYESSVDTTLEVEIITGTAAPVWNAVLGKAPASATWKEFTSTYTVPAGVTAISIYQPLNKVGYVISDDYSLTEYTPQGFTQGMVSVTLDDGWVNQYTNAHPTLSGLGLPATYYIISDEVKDAAPVNGADYMTRANVQALFAGNEIGSHTKDHCELTTGLTEPSGPACPGFNLESEMHDSKTVLEGIVGAGNVTDFAYPYGSYNATTIAVGQPYYASQRSVERGFNSIDNWNVTKLKIQEVDTANTNAEVEGWINQAKNDHTWLILTYHEVADTATAGDEGYNVTKANFTAQMTALKNSGVAVKTVHDALAELLPQVGGTVTPPAVKPGDATGEGTVDGLDLDLVLRNWGKSSQTLLQGNLSGDSGGVIDGLDLDLVLRNWSK